MTGTPNRAAENGPGVPSEHGLLPSEEAAVELRNVSYGIRGIPILSDISFSVARGEVFGVMGMSGCGKSTLLKLIMGLIRPDSGEVVIQAENIAGLPERELKACGGEKSNE